MTFQWPQEVVDKAVTRLSDQPGIDTEDRFWVHADVVIVLDAIAPDVEALVEALEQVKSEACICHMDYGSGCGCDVGSVAEDALARWRQEKT